ncbi:hypothetical protein HRbin17_00573 [bacterium HR17]|jgi:hypothetical protein|uniref:Uncharacterized protein n=1 Tax=Candidatus Fervidibacter japonicus TaxID=2035412 RepID=A0A2H5XA62_9BACT|nr:hypothetical protein HRbin17_00573 [bacterium HR17]
MMAQEMVPIYVQSVVSGANADNDICPLGRILYDGWRVVSGDDDEAGREFGHFEGQGHRVVPNGPLTTPLPNCQKGR